MNLTIPLLFALGFALYKWFSNYVDKQAALYLFLSRGYREPTDYELREASQKVIARMLKSKRTGS